MSTEKKMAHTPGPWTWTYDGSGDYSIGPDDPQVNPVANIVPFMEKHDPILASQTPPPEQP